MQDKIVEDSFKKMLFDMASSINVFDIFNDVMTGYESVQDGLKEAKKLSITEYVDALKTQVEPLYLKDYMNAISIPKLEELQKEGHLKYHFKYQSFDGKKYEAASTLIDDNGKKLVLLVAIEDKNQDKEESGNEKFNSLLDATSDAILKINNVFNLQNKQGQSVDKLENYITTVTETLSNQYPELKKELNKSYANISGMVNETILIVDDDALTRNMIKRIFADDYKIVMAQNGKEAIDYLDKNSTKGASEEVDHVLGIFLDLTMPVLDGFAVLEYLSKKNYLAKIPVIIISGDYEKETKIRVYNYNIADMLEKPFDFEVVRHRIGNFINLYKSSNTLNEIVNSETSYLKDIIDTFIWTYKKDYAENIRRVKSFVHILGKQVIKDYPDYGLDDDKLLKIEDAVSYYDVGFTSVPRKYLSNGTFDEEATKVIRNYPLFGEEIVKYVYKNASDDELKKYALEITKHYHENYDGSGYPDGLKGDAIPLSAQIVSICVAYNNLLKRKVEDAKIEDVIIKSSGIMFNPRIVGSFMKVIEEFQKIS